MFHAYHSEPNTSEKEEIILALFDHWIVMVKPFFIVLCSWIIFAATVLMGNTFKESSFISLGFVLGGLMFLVGAHHYLFLRLVQWQLSRCYVTTIRVIDLEIKPFIKNDLKYININEIHEIEKMKRGLFANIFDFGNVVINVAALPEPLIFDYVPSPSKLVNIVDSIRANRLHDQIDPESLQGMMQRKYQLWMMGE